MTFCDFEPTVSPQGELRWIWDLFFAAELSVLGLGEPTDMPRDQFFDGFRVPKSRVFHGFLGKHGFS